MPRDCNIRPRGDPLIGASPGLHALKCNYHAIKILRPSTRRCIEDHFGDILKGIFIIESGWILIQLYFTVQADKRVADMAEDDVLAALGALADFARQA